MAREPLLDLSEVNSPAWQKLKVHIESRIDTHRKRNDGDLSETDTATLRGQIKELKALLKEVEPPEIQTKKPKRNEQ